MKNSYLCEKLDKSNFQITSHGFGEKFVFCTNDHCNTNLTQAAFGKLKAGEKVESHIHPTMEEFFFFQSGVVDFYIGDESLHVTAGTFIKVPINTDHKLDVIEDAEYIYWGIAL